MPGYSDPGFDTLALHAGAAPDPATGARAVPIHLTTSFVFESSDHAASLFNLERAGHVYSRISNPTNAVLEQRVSALEGGIGAIATASGQAALHLSIATLMGAGSHIVASTALYGGSQNLLHYTLRRFGIDTTFVQPGDMDGWRAAVRPNTKLFFGETVGNPGLDVLDMATVSGIAHEAGVPLLVDSTLTSPWLIKPFEHGADLVYHSATKFLSGHGTVIGGIVVDGGSFDWDASGKFPELTEAYDGFHNMVFSEESTVGAFLLRARREGLRDFGACMSPHTAWLILQGIETLPLRMARHMSNTEKIVQYLASHPLVARVGHPMLESHPSHALAKKLLPRGAGSVFSFDIKGQREQGKAFIEALKVFSHLANVGDCRSLVIHPASTTHFRMTDEALLGAGITQGTIRLSIGLEDPDDLIDDLKRALKAAEKLGNAAPKMTQKAGA
jgi:O-acetylhomoserine (thiol)-lyase